MNNPVPIPPEFSPRTTRFEIGTASHSSTTTPCRIYQFEFYQSNDTMPAGSQLMSSLVGKWELDADRRAAMRAARARWAERLNLSRADSIRGMRLHRGLSQSALAKILGTSQSHIARIEKGSMQITLDTCRRLATAFEVDLNAINRAFTACSENEEAEA